MANMNITSPTAAKIFASWLKRGREERPRNYLGASIIGHECDMYLWLMFRNAVNDSFDGRMYRLFDRGKREEAVFCDDLRNIGCEVKEFDENGNQWSVSALGGHFGGHLDGIVRGIDEAPNKWHVVEFKTHSDSSFKKLCKEGVKQAKPMHYAQMQTYMGHTGLDCAMYMAVNKDNDDLWCERVKFDKPAFDAIMARAKHVIDTTMPDRCASRRDDWRCKACPCASVCWHDAKQFVDPLVPVTCKTCCHATAVTDGDAEQHWTCRLGHACSTDENSCCDHLFLPAFVNGTPVDGDDYGIKYDYVKGTVVIGKTGFSSEEAQKFGPNHIASVEIFKNLHPGMKVEKSNTIAVKYGSDDTCSVDFSGSVEELREWIPFHPIADFSKPLLVEEFGGVKFFDYGNVAVAISKENATVKSFNPQF